MRKGAAAVLLVSILGGIIMFSLCGCQAKKYKVDYLGRKGMYSNAKDRYRAGTQVTLYVEHIATDTDYSFYLDGEGLRFTYDERKGFVISFTMPEHDVTLECYMRNSMERLD